VGGSEGTGGAAPWGFQVVWLLGWGPAQGVLGLRVLHKAAGKVGRAEGGWGAPRGQVVQLLGCPAAAPEARPGGQLPLEGEDSSFFFSFFFFEMILMSPTLFRPCA